MKQCKTCGGVGSHNKNFTLDTDDVERMGKRLALERLDHEDAIHMDATPRKGDFDRLETWMLSHLENPDCPEAIRQASNAFDFAHRRAIGFAAQKMIDGMEARCHPAQSDLKN